ncbi:hypothetical protein KVH27_19540 [Streptomyces olivaceus]|uniref:hypothetical protein n=1 Tax=Streptomyces olivaceus TaxID=47716 RepID=UPI001CCEBB2A|nr:hypothetical protein [Streptomyces olivaceus]MBZ6250562.1 hypothetical protein [Streptomyces olivaceus]
MAAEISLPVYVRVGDTEARWGELTIEASDGAADEQVTRRALAAFLRAAADHLETLAEEVPDAAARG